MGLTIETFLNQLREEGRFHSTSGFTLNPELAQKKLEQFQLPWPRGYIVKVIQYAVARGADSIAVKERGHTLEVTFNGEPTLSEQVAQAINYLILENVPPAERPLCHLGAALRGAVGLNPESVYFESSEGRQSYRQVWNEFGWRVDRSGLSKGQGPLSRFGIVRDSSSFFGLFFRAEETPSSELSERELLESLCSLSPATISFNGEPLAAGFFGVPPQPAEEEAGHELIADLFDRRYHLFEAHISSQPGERTSLKKLRSYHPPTVEGECRAWIGVAAGLSSRGKVVYVDDGAFLCRRVHDFQCPGLFVVYSSELLTKDLSGFQLVEDSLYRNHRNWLSEQAESLRARLRTYALTQPEPLERRILKALKRTRTP